VATANTRCRCSQRSSSDVRREKSYDAVHVVRGTRNVGLHRHGLADAAFFDFDSPLFFAFLSNVLAGLLLLCGYRLQRTHSFSVGHASAWGTRIVVGALVVFAGTVAVLIAATREPGRSLTCSGHCGTEDEGVVAGASIASAIGSQTAAALASRREQWLVEGRCFMSVGVRVVTDPTRPASVQRSTVSSAARFRTRRVESRSWTNRTCARRLRIHRPRWPWASRPSCRRSRVSSQKRTCRRLSST